MQKLLALDCSTKATGIAIYGDKQLLGHSVISASSTDVIKRIHKMVDTINQLVTEAGINIVVMEEVIPDHAKNINTFKALMYLQAAIVIMLHDEHPGVKLELVYPGSWRSTCGIKTGRGVQRETLKQADIRFANKTYSLNISSDDEADAICIGHAYLHPKNDPDNGELNWGE